MNFTHVQLSGGKGQIINLGAGFDTLYWRLREAGNTPTNFIELDFPSVTAKKCYHIKKHKQLIDMLNTEGTTSYDYYLIVDILITHVHAPFCTFQRYFCSFINIFAAFDRFFDGVELFTAFKNHQIYDSFRWNTLWKYWTIYYFELFR